MHDDNGLYYYPDPTNTQVRVYVREEPGGVSFRLWHQDHPQVWEQHEWLNYEVIKAAAAMYKERGSGTDPLTLYDVNVARALLKEETRKR